MALGLSCNNTTSGQQPERRCNNTPRDMPAPRCRHTRSDCDPSNYDRVHKKKRCPVPGCREKLTTLTSCEWPCRGCQSVLLTPGFTSRRWQVCSRHKPLLVLAL